MRRSAGRCGFRSGVSSGILWVAEARRRGCGAFWAAWGAMAKSAKGLLKVDEDGLCINVGSYLSYLSGARVSVRVT
jgi:hypothetical protein